MSALVSNLCDEVTAILNATDFGVECTATKSYVPSLELKGAGETVYLTVAPQTTGYRRDSRSATGRPVEIGIGIQRRLPREDPDTVVETMLDVVERVATELHGTRVAALSAVCISIQNDPIYAPDHMKDVRLFTSVLTTQWEAVQ